MARDIMAGTTITCKIEKIKKEEKTHRHINRQGW